MNTRFLTFIARGLRLGLLSVLLATAPARAAASDTNVVPATAPAAPPSAAPDEPLILKAMALTIPILAIVMGIGIVLLLVWTEYAKRRAVIEACHRERLAALEKGLEPPPFPAKLWESEDGAEKPAGSGLKTGLLLIAVGVGLAAFFWPEGGRFHPVVGAIPGALGVAYLLYYVFEGRHRAAQAVRTAADRVSER